MLHVLKHQTWGLEWVKCQSLSHMYTNREFLNSVPFSWTAFVYPSKYLLTPRSSWSSFVNETSWSCWQRTLFPAHHLHLAGQESDTSTCPFENWCWLRHWTHWTEADRPKTAETTHNAFPAKGYGLSFSHISFLTGLSHWLSWRPTDVGAIVPLKSSLMEHIY